MSALAPEELLALVPALPKVVLHDHLDGGLRPATVVELAAEVGHELPTTDPEELGAWFRDSADSGSLERYLETFEHTVAVMQTPQALHRVAYEAAVDLAADGVVYAEQRYAPEQHQRAGMALADVVRAVQEGFAAGEAAAAQAGTPIRTGTLLTGMRHADRSAEIARLTLEHRDAGVVGYDIAGAEAGFPPARHREAFDLLHAASFPVTVHAGEAAGVESIAEALHPCGAQRIGHGIRVLEDVSGLGSDDVRLGRVAAWVRDRRVPLELCPSSNVQTGAATSVAEHGITALKELGFLVTLNTDNRLMSGTTMTREMQLLVTEAGWTLDDLRQVTEDALRSAFWPRPDREALLADLVSPAYAAVAWGELAPSGPGR